ncbi:bifunctional coenzyme A synthase isoform X4 [Rana temporaria]|uniref:bifunctional coenzyme A synthase isoform X4 n=1 Tax=Rana temporaria TaxID=8407 RepID=UPI001AADAD27|nr:bifunctional coenzyme A synthase isoform X4 [Rana temporaria]
MSVFRSGVLVLTSPLSALSVRLAPILASAAKIVQDTLYVHLQPGLLLTGSSQPSSTCIPATNEVCKLISKLYSDADVYSNLDVRVLLTNIKNQSNSQQIFSSVQNLSHPPEVVLTDFQTSDGGQYNPAKQQLERYATNCYSCHPNLISILLYPDYEQADYYKPEELNSGGTLLQCHSDVVVGGTFDRLHSAHKILLSVCGLLSDRRLLIGVADGELLDNKILKELIEPYEKRVNKLSQFLVDVKPSLIYDMVPISDPYGPSITDPDLKCIVVSEETRKGGLSVNRRRLENGLEELDVHEIKLVTDPQHSKIEEEKISSSSLRNRLLGTLLKTPTDQLKHLTDIVWPAIAALAKEAIEEATTNGMPVCVMDAAVLLEAGWDNMVHEIWTVIIPEKEAVVRIMNRDGVTEDSAKNRLSSQMSNNERVVASNVVLCTLWDPEITQIQVQKAWDLLQQRIHYNASKASPVLT